MPNLLLMENPKRSITWRIDLRKGLYLTLKDENDKVIGKAFLSSEQIHKFICLNNKL